MKHTAVANTILWTSALLCALLVTGCGRDKKRIESQGSQSVVNRESQKSEELSNQSPQGNESSTKETVPSTVITAHHVLFDEASGLHLKAEWLQGRLYPARPGVIPSLDDPSSFKVEIEEGKMKLSMDDLSHLLVTRVLKGTRLSKIRLSARGPHEIQINAILHKVAPLPVQLTGLIGATADGRIRIDIQSMKVMKIPFKGLLHALKIAPSDLTDLKDSAAVQVIGDSIYLRTDQLLPAPRKLGRVTDVHFDADGQLEEVYGEHSHEMPSPDNWKPGKWSNFMRLFGGTIRFGKLTMIDADLILIDASPGDWFEFSLARYRDQLAKGDMHMTQSGGLRVFLPAMSKGSDTSDGR